MVRTKKKLKCAPAVRGGRCLSSRDILSLKAKWNANNKQQINTQTTESIMDALYELNPNCSHDVCIIRKTNDHELLNRFTPIAPKSWESKPRTWLTSKDIKHVIDQHVETNKDFEFIGTCPIDWYVKKTRDSDEECLCDKICKLDLVKKQSEGINKIGIVFNLDEHDKPGSHWVSMFINIPEKRVYFFDSQGFRCPHRIKKVYNELKARDKNLVFEGNYNIEHQKKNTECGVYCIFFILQMLKKNDYGVFNNKHHTYNDDYMFKKRGEYFNIV